VAGVSLSPESFSQNRTLRINTDHGLEIYESGPFPVDPVAVDNRFALLTGGTPNLIEPDYKGLPTDATTLAMRNIGVPAFLGDGIVSITKTTTSSGNTFTTPAGWDYWFCFCTIDPYTDEIFRGPAYVYPVFDVAADFGPRLYRTITISFTADFMSRHPFYFAPDNSFIEVYRNRDGTPLLTDINNTVIKGAPAFPTGVMIGRIQIDFQTPVDNAFQPLTITFTDPPNIVSDYRALLFHDPDGDTWVDLNRDFDVVVISVADTVVPQEKYLLPPTRVSTGAFFQGSLVLNDLDNPRKIVFSYPNDIDAWPALFYITFNSKDNDQVSAVRALGKSLGVFTKTGLWRVNWLPTEADVSFERGTVSELVCTRGTFWPQSVCEFTDSAGSKLAWVSDVGVFATDLYQTQHLTAHLDWAAMGIAPNITTLVNNKNSWRLELWCGQKGYYIHYHPSHVRDGVMAVTGPIDRPGNVFTSCTTRDVNGIEGVITTDRFGSFFLEGGTAVDESLSGLALNMILETREIYPGGMGMEGTLEDSYLHMKPAPFITTNYAALIYPGPSLPPITEILTSGQRELRIICGVHGCETVKLVFAGSGLPMALNAFGYDWNLRGPTQR
jgi:hypothetical protein